VRAAQLARVARTAAHVPPGQAANWARLRAQRGLLRASGQARQRLLAAAPATGPVGWPAGYRPLDARLTRTWPPMAELRAGKITLLGLTRDLAGPAGWCHHDAPRLWRFHLHYWDWAWALAAGADTGGNGDVAAAAVDAGGKGDVAPGNGAAGEARELFAQLWTTWSTATSFARGDAWHPYPAALRAWSWCGLYAPLAAGGDLAPKLAAALTGHAAFLRRHLETDVAGNHLIKGLKALAGLAVFTGDHQALHAALTRLARQARRQVLPDGGHCERAPAYHCQVLADLIDVANLAEAAGIAPPRDLTAAIWRMRRWLGAVLGPDGEVPLLGDGYPVPRELLSLLRPAPPGEEPLVVLPSSGLARLSTGGWQVLADAGGPGRWGVAAHAHAGTLGCLVYSGRAPLVIDTGTSTYADSPARAYERSTAAHNTAEVDGTDSSEVWGAFRVGRRARARWLATYAHGGAVVCAASHDGYRHLPGRPVHRRRWTLTAGTLVVDDLISGRGRHKVAVHWHLAPGTALRLAGPASAVITGPGEFRVRVTGSAGVRLASAVHAAARGFGLTADSPLLVCRAEGPLPLRIRTVWTRGGLAGEEAVA
jgi:uncharacterized heparinase superfamily protein